MDPVPPAPTPEHPAARAQGGRVPVGWRLVCGALGGIMAGLVASRAWGFREEGLPISALAAAGASLPFILVLAAIAVAPGLVARLVPRGSRFDLSDGGHVFALLLVLLTSYVVFAVGSIATGAYQIETALHGRDAPFPELSSDAILFSVAFNVVLMVPPVLAWLSFVNGVRAADLWSALGLRAEGAGRAAASGVGLGLGLVVALLLVSVALAGVGYTLPENEQALAIARGVTIPAAFFVAVGSSFSEEVFFRGFLFPRLGLFAQAFLFGLAHVSYVNVLEVVVTFGFAYALALSYRRTGSLWAPIAAHFSFNLAMLVGAKFAVTGF